MANLYTQNFDGLTPGAAVPGWTNSWAASAIGAVSAPNAMTSPTGGDGDTTYYTGIAAAMDMDFYYSMIVTMDGSKAAFTGAFVRSNYLCLLTYTNPTTAKLVIYIKSGGFITPQIPLIYVTGLTSGCELRTRIMIKGSVIYYKAWNNSVGTEPAAWAYNFKDTTQTTPGYVGFYYIASTNVDNIVINDVTPTDDKLYSDPAIIYSPDNWGNGIAINQGAYFKTIFNASSCVVNFNQVGYVAPNFPQIYYRVDGYNSQGWTRVSMDQNSVLNLNVNIPTDTAGQTNHYLEVVVKAISDDANRWGGVASAVKLDSISLPVGGTLIKPQTVSNKIRVWGDSITQGLGTINLYAARSVDGEDAMLSWAYLLGGLIGAEVGVIGASGQGFNLAGLAGVPRFQDAINFIYSGFARSFSPVDADIINMGTNDSNNDVTSYIITALNTLIASTSTASPIIVLRPFNGSQAANLQTAISQCNAPSRCYYVDTTGFFDTTQSSDGVHPLGIANIGKIAPLVAAQVKTILKPTAYKLGFKKMLNI